MRVRVAPLRLAGMRLAGRGLIVLALAALALGVITAAAPAALAHGAAPTRPAHALPVRTDPTANAILATPPSQVRIWFSEEINPDSSSLIVIDPSNHEVDTRDTRVIGGRMELTVGLQLLRPGAYVVVWRAQAVDDGHVTGGSFIFRIANADGSVPPVPATLPTSSTPGAAGYGVGNTSLDGPGVAQAAFTWLALLLLTFWTGGVIWETWVAPVGTDGEAGGARLAALRFRRLAPYALGGLLLADIGLAAALTVEIAGSARGLLAPQFWRATLLSGQFGAYWWMRQAVAAVALVLTLAPARRAGASLVAGTSAAEPETEAVKADTGAEPVWTHELTATLRAVPGLPRRLWRGWQAQGIVGRAELALAALLLFAFAMSGHAAATPPSERAYAVTIDYLHLLATAAWLGGLLYISAVLLPAARKLPERARAQALARGVPTFSALAIVAAAFLSLTGSLNATVRLTSASQLITTIYGRILTVKIEIFLVMVAISAYHAFHLRPRLTRALAMAAATAPKRAAVAAASGKRGQTRADTANRSVRTTGAPTAKSAKSEALTPAARALAARLTDWLRREALLGGGVLLCVALLGGFAGTLGQTQAAAPVNTSAFLQTQSAGGYHITLQVAPASFGSNTFTVTVTDAQGKPTRDAGVLLLIDSLDMAMGEGSFQLKAAGAAQPGVYSGPGDLTMSGHWRITVKVLPHGASDYVAAQFALLAGAPPGAPISAPTGTTGA